MTRQHPDVKRQRVPRSMKKQIEGKSGRQRRRTNVIQGGMFARSNYVTRKTGKRRIFRTRRSRTV